MSHTENSERLVVIATKKCFIKAKTIKHVLISEQKDYLTDSKGKDVTTICYDIEIYYVCHDIGSGSVNRDQEQKASIKVYDKKEAYDLYEQIVRQVRDQEPDHMLMDKLFEEFIFNKGENNDGSTDKVRRTGKAKGTR